MKGKRLSPANMPIFGPSFEFWGEDLFTGTVNQGWYGEYKKKLSVSEKYISANAL